MNAERALKNPCLSVLVRVGRKPILLIGILGYVIPMTW